MQKKRGMTSRRGMDECEVVKSIAGGGAAVEGAWVCLFWVCRWEEERDGEPVGRWDNRDGGRDQGKMRARGGREEGEMKAEEWEWRL